MISGIYIHSNDTFGGTFTLIFTYANGRKWAGKTKPTTSNLIRLVICALDRIIHIFRPSSLY
jgi:hypothetical protein